MKQKVKKSSRAKDRHANDNAPQSVVERRQVAALPFRKTPAGEIEVLLITSRETGRFIIPKGWPMKRLSDPDAAAQEAYEEAGIVGKVKRKPIDDYFYWKRLERAFEFVKVEVYALEVRQQRDEWPEKNSRRCAWHSKTEAASRVMEPGLVALLKTFRP